MVIDFFLKKHFPFNEMHARHLKPNISTVFYKKAKLISCTET